MFLCDSVPSVSSQPQESLEETFQLCEELGLEEGALPDGSYEWCERSPGGVDTLDFDLWYSDNLSPEAGNSVQTSPGLEDTYTDQQATCHSICVGHTKARRRESLSAKDQRDVTDTSEGQSNFHRTKHSENHADPDVTRHRVGSHLQHSTMETVCTHTGVNNPESYSSCGHRKQGTDSKVTRVLHSLKVTAKCRTVDQNLTGMTNCLDSEICTFHTDSREEKTVETINEKRSQATNGQRSVLCKSQREKAENRDTGCVELNTGSNGCRNDCDDMLSVRHWDRIGHKQDVLGVCTDNILEENQNITDSCSMKTGSALNNTPYPHVWLEPPAPRTQKHEDHPGRGLSPQVCTGLTRPQEKPLLLDVCTTTEKAPKTEIRSAETGASSPLDSCATELFIMKLPPCKTVQPLQIPCQTKMLIPSHLDQMNEATDVAPHKDFHSLEKSQSVSAASDSAGIQSNTWKESVDCLTRYPFSNNLLFFSGNLGVEDTSPWLPEDSKSERRKEGTCYSLHQNSKQEGGGNRVFFDQEQVVKAVNGVGISQSPLGTWSREPRVIPQGFVSVPDACVAQYVPSRIGKPHPFTAASIQGSWTDHAGLSRCFSRPQLGPNISASPWSLDTSLSQLLDTNNNSKASMKCDLHRSPAAALSDLKRKDSWEDVDRSREDTEELPLSLDHRPLDNLECGFVIDWDCTCVPQRDEPDKLKRDMDIRTNPVVQTLDLPCSNADKKCVLTPENKGVSVDKEVHEDNRSPPQNHHVPCQARGSSLESLKGTLVEHTQVGVPSPPLELKVVRTSDINLNLLPFSCLEPILEADLLVECKAEENSKAETSKEQVSRPAATNLLPDVTGAEVQLQLNSAFQTHRSSSKRHWRPASCSAASHLPASSQCIEANGSDFADYDKYVNCEKVTKKSKRVHRKGNKGHKFGVFGKMHCFNKTNDSISQKREELALETSAGRAEDLLSELEKELEENSHNEVENNLLHLTAKACSTELHKQDKEDVGFFPSVPDVCLFVSQRDGQGGTFPDNMRDVHSGHRQADKMSQSNDSLNLRMRFSQAHRSLSSLFESRTVELDSEGLSTMDTDGDSGKVKQSWRPPNKPEDDHLLNRTISMPGGDCSKISSGHDHGHFLTSLLQHRLSGSESPSSLRNLHYSDSISKWGLSHWSEKQINHCISEGRPMKWSPDDHQVSSGCVSHLHLSSEDSAVSCPNQTSPPSNLSLGLANNTFNSTQSPFSTRTPQQSMSPKSKCSRPTAYWKHFQYPQPARAISVSSFLLGQSASVEGLIDPPERPKILKPSPRPPYVAEDSADHQSHISLDVVGSISDFKVRSFDRMT